MATIKQLEKQKQDLVNNMNRIINETAIPINDKVAFVKELSKAIAYIAEQISRMSVSTVTPKEKKEIQQQQRKEEIKEIKKVKKELQPSEIPEKVRKENGVCQMLLKCLS
jgi:hypothetical protein